MKLFQGDEGARRATPSVLQYARLRPGYETPLYAELWARFNDMGFDSLFEAAKQISGFLGGWCSDYFWSFAFSEKEAKKREAKAMRRAQKISVGKSTDVVDLAIARLQEAGQFVNHYTFEELTKTPRHLSSKVLALLDVLQVHFELPTEQKCLVFVEQRATARLLNHVAKVLGNEHLRPGMLTGTNSTSMASINYTHKEQAVTMMRFRNGELNCLVRLTQPKTCGDSAK